MQSVEVFRAGSIVWQKVNMYELYLLQTALKYN